MPARIRRPQGPAGGAGCPSPVVAFLAHVPTAASPWPPRRAPISSSRVRPSCHWVSFNGARPAPRFPRDPAIGFRGPIPAWEPVGFGAGRPRCSLALGRNLNPSSATLDPDWRERAPIAAGGRTPGVPQPARVPQKQRSARRGGGRQPPLRPSVPTPSCCSGLNLEGEPTTAGTRTEAHQ